MAMFARVCFPSFSSRSRVGLSLTRPYIFSHLHADLQRAMAAKLENEADLSAFLSFKASKVDDALLCALSRTEVQAGSPFIFPRGKRIHPTLCLAACELVGGSADAAMPVACAIELIHKMSESRALQSRPSFVGLAYEQVASATEAATPETLSQVVLELSKAAGVDGLVCGLFLEREMDQMAFSENRGQHEDVEMLNHVHYKKTAALVEGAVASGAILGGGSEAAVERLRRYARYLSLLFEVVVDILETEISDGDHKRDSKIAYPNLLGLDESKRFAQELHMQAKHQLGMFDFQEAQYLHKLADYVLSLID